MTYEEFKSAVDTMIANLTVLKNQESAAWAFKYNDVPISVCEAAAHIGGFDETFAKMFNKSFREDAVEYAIKHLGA